MRLFEWLFGTLIGPIIAALALLGVTTSRTLGTLLLVAAWIVITLRLSTDLRAEPRNIRWAALLGATFFYGIGLAILLTRPTVTVYPSSFLLHTGTHSNKTNIEIRNIGTETAYGVFLKVWSDNSSVRVSDISIEATDENPNAPILKTSCGRGTVEIRMDVLIFGWIDSRSRSAKLVKVYSIEPGTSRHFSVWGAGSIKSYASTAIIGTSEQPDRALTKPQQLISLMVAPEDGRPVGSLTFRTGEVEMGSEVCVPRIRLEEWNH